MKTAKIVFVVMITLLVMIMGFNSVAADCPGDITITTPEDGEIVSGNTYEITWDSPLCDNGEDIKLYYCYKTNSNICRFIDGVDANDLTYSWDTTSMDENREYWLEAKIEDLIYYTSDNKFYVDNSGPEEVVVEHDGPDTGRWHTGESNDGDVTFSLETPDDIGNSGLKGYWIVCDTTVDTDPSINPDVPEGYPANEPDYMCDFAEGQSNYFHIRAYDFNGNLGPITHVGPFWIDETIPQINSYSTNQEYYKVGDTITFEVDAEDILSGGVMSDMKHVKFFVGGHQIDPTLLDRIDSAAPYEYTGVLTDDMYEGIRGVGFRVIDLAGNEIIEHFDIITLDKTEPEIVSVEYRDDDMSEGDHGNEGWIVGDGDTMTITATFSDTSGIKETTPQITIDCTTVDGDVILADMNMDTNLVWTYDYFVDYWGLNEYCDVTITVDDRAGNIFEETYDDAILHDNIAPIVSNAVVSPGYHRLGNIVYAAFDVDEVNRYYPSARIYNIGAGTNRKMIAADVEICNTLFGDDFDECYSTELDSTEGQDAIISMVVRDLAGNRGASEGNVVHTDFIAPTQPNIDQFNRDPYYFTATTDSSIFPFMGSEDINPDNWWTYEKKINEDPWMITDETELTGFDFDLLPNHLNTLCIRGIDLATNRGDEDCVNVGSDDSAPAQVDDLEVFDALAPDTVTLRWSDVSDLTTSDYASGIYYYRIYAWKFSDYGRCFDNIKEDGVIELDTAVMAHDSKTVDISELNSGKELYEGREYCFAVVAYDNAGNYQSDVQYEIGIPYANEEIDLVDDWNFISTPVIIAEPNMDDVFSEVIDDVIIVWYYDGENHEWLSWIPDGGEDNDFTTFDHGKGYLVDMRESHTLEIAGRYSGLLNGGELIPEYPVFESWNMVGYTKSGPDTTASVENYFVSVIWDPNTVLTRYPDIGLVGVENMDAGQGYWLNVGVDGSFAPGYDPLV
jgi:hypothetical protein